MTRYVKICLALAVSWVAAPGLAFGSETHAIIHARLLTITHGSIDNGTLIITDGKISHVGGPETEVPRDAKIHDATGMTVYPGLIDAINDDALVTGSIHGATRISDLPVGMPAPDAQAAERVSSTPPVLVNRLNGLLNAGISPGDQGPEPGQVAFIQYDSDASNMVLIPDAALILNFRESARREAGYPSTAYGIAGFFRNQLVALEDYRRGVTLQDAQGKPVPDARLDALIPFVDGKRPIIIYAQTDTQIGVALDIAEEFSLRIIIAGAANIDREVDRIARLRVPVIFGNVWDLPLAGRRYDAVQTTPARLSQSGVRLALSTMGRGAGGSRNLPYMAGTAVAYGLAWDQALRAITLTPAEFYGVDDRLGSLDIGKWANIVIATGDPLNVSTDVKQVFLKGVPITMESFQTRLRDQYTKK